MRHAEHGSFTVIVIFSDFIVNVDGRPTVWKKRCAMRQEIKRSGQREEEEGYLFSILLVTTIRG